MKIIINKMMCNTVILDDGNQAIGRECDIDDYRSIANKLISTLNSIGILADVRIEK